MMLHQGLRRTGRTERMIRDAIDAMGLGRSSVVVAADDRHQRALVARIMSHLPSSSLTEAHGQIRIGCDSASITVVRDTSGLVSMSDGKVGGSARMVFVDHWTVEARYGFALEVVSPFATRDNPHLNPDDDNAIDPETRP